MCNESWIGNLEDPYSKSVGIFLSSEILIFFFPSGAELGIAFLNFGAGRNEKSYFENIFLLPQNFSFLKLYIYIFVVVLFLGA